MEYKKCIVCGETKEITEFYFRNDLHKYNNKCKECIKKCEIERYQKNSKKRNAKAREYYKKNRDSVLEEKKKYYEENKDKILENDRQYYSNNKQKIVKRAVKYQMDRIKTDEAYKMRIRVMALMNKYFRKKHFKRSAKMFDIIGCNYNEFYNHLLETFEKNYGYKYNGEKVDIDHIIPACLAKNGKELEKLFHYSNLQLLKSHDNLIKGSKTTKLNLS